MESAASAVTNAVKKSVDLKFLSFIGSAIDLSNEMYSFSNWAIDSGLTLNKAIQLKDYNNLGMGYGICAKESIPPTQYIFRFPFSYAVSNLDFVLCLLMIQL